MSENGAHGNTGTLDSPMNAGDKGAPGSVRIIGGHWRGTRLQVPGKPGLRPTSDRVRETLFNWLQMQLPGARVLDLFAGSGALGLEAISRGAAQAHLVETDPGLVQTLRAVTQRLDAAGRVQVHAIDARRFLADWSGPQFDIAFVDPPFADDLWLAVLPALAAKMAASGWIYVESPADSAPNPGPEWALHRENRTREVRYALFRRVNSP